MRKSAISPQSFRNPAMAAISVAAWLLLVTATAGAPRALAQIPAPSPTPTTTAPATPPPGSGTTIAPNSPVLPGDSTTGDTTPTLAKSPRPNPAATPAPGPAASAAAGGDATDTGTSLLNTHTFGGNDLRRADRAFARLAVANNLQAEELGRLAAAKAANPAVKSFAQTLADDSDKLHIQLLVAGNAAGVTLPSELGDDARATYRTLAALAGPDFDRAFLDAVVKRHAADLATFEREAGNRHTEVNLRKFATAAAPVLKQQLDAAKGLQGTLAGGAPAADGAATPPPGNGHGAAAGR